MQSVLQQAAEKRALIRRWAATAIPLAEAEARGLVRYSGRVPWRNWTTRETLYDFAAQSAQAAPVLVRVDARRMALYTAKRADASPPVNSHQPPATSHQPPATSHQPPATSHRTLKTEN